MWFFPDLECHQIKIFYDFFVSSITIRGIKKSDAQLPPKRRLGLRLAVAEVRVFSRKVNDNSKAFTETSAIALVFSLGAGQL